MRRSTLVSRALDRRDEIRAEFELLREAAFRRAQDELGGARLLNERGLAAGVDPYSLFIGPELRAYAYASEELVNHWQRYPRPVFERFEQQMADVPREDIA